MRSNSSSTTMRRCAGHILWAVLLLVVVGFGAVIININIIVCITSCSSSTSGVVDAWTVTTIPTHPRISIPSSSYSHHHRLRYHHTITALHVSTPFELEYYTDDDNENGGDNNSNNNKDNGDDDDDSSFAEPPPSPPLACPRGTKLVIGLNKYSHDTSICAADAKTGKVLFAMSKERLSRQKHDGGNTASLVELCLDTLDLDYYGDDQDDDDDEKPGNVITKVVMNNHHHRILPLEKNLRHIEWESGLGINGGSEPGYEDEYNLLKDLDENDNGDGDEGAEPRKIELSHHLAHAYSTATQAPFDTGLVVVMDGMGESYRTMLHARATNDPTYISDLSFPRSTTSRNDDDFAFECIPSNLVELSQSAEYTPYDWREAESVYVFEKKHDTKTIDLKPIFKRFTSENSSPTLYNHGFENMDSAGAIYSRASSHIFGDWNACGKVMGLAPWISHEWTSHTAADKTIITSPKQEEQKVMWGTLYSEYDGKQFQQNKDVIAGMPLISRIDSDLFDDDGNLMSRRRYDFDDNQNDGNSLKDKVSTNLQKALDGSVVDDESNYTDSGTGEEQQARLPTKIALDAISLAHRVQIDLEDIVLDFVKHFKSETGETNLCIAGGVGLNSVLNGRLARELGFSQTFISPYPGDDGIAVGCCAYGLFGNEILDGRRTSQDDDDSLLSSSLCPPIWKESLSPYLGPMPTEDDILDALEDAAPWLEYESVEDEDVRVGIAAREIENGGVIAWYTGRSELGPRALGHRSILADPRKKGLVRFINEFVKKRESFRPFAPSALVEHATEWFDLGVEDDSSSNVSPYMSMTAMVKEEKRARIPAVTHVDGSSRLQTVTAESEPLYHQLISKFYELTGVPMVLNTSFNTLPGEPIVESPKDAVRSFLCSMGSIEVLFLGKYVVRRRVPNLRSLLGEMDKKDGRDIMVEPACPKLTGPATFETTLEIDDDADDSDDDAQNVPKNRVRMPSRPMHYEGKGGAGGWFEILDGLEGEVLASLDGQTSLNDILAEYTATPEDDEDDTRTEEERLAFAEELLQNVVARIVRLYEHTLIQW
mmetsp:Transcript_46767/g.113984  ORF Transcript_46767/g.113984 Transcript_46767/m.113984 type:complete len:1053 (-) Transcript_46767:41-3199(-)